MSEKAPHSPERLHQPNNPEVAAATEKRAEKQSSELERESQKKSVEALSKARELVDHEAVSGKDVAIEKNSESSASSVQPIINHELKQHMFERTLVHVRKRLPFTQRQLSKIVHSQPIEVLSSAGEKTVARPIGLLGGGLAALAGSSILIYFSRHSGYRYNFLLFLLLFIAGYAVATLLEVLFSLLHRQKHGR